MRIDVPKPEQEEALRALWQLSFGDSEEATALFFRTGYDPQCCRCAVENGEIAGALYWFDIEHVGQKMAYLYGVATHPKYRNRGLCKRLMEDTHKLLRAAGYAAALLTPADVSLRAMYARMGYEDCCTLSEVTAQAGMPVPVREIAPGEFASLRRKYLPQGGVIQEGRNLSYLSGYAKLYTGDDFLLAAVKEGEGLLGLELLGNAQAAPGILAALDCKTGSFRIPGKDLPFSMFQALQPGAERPRYLGLAFD